MGYEVSSVRGEVGLDKGKSVIVVPGINYRVPKDEECRNKRLPVSNKKSHCNKNEGN